MTVPADPPRAPSRSLLVAALVLLLAAVGLASCSLFLGPSDDELREIELVLAGEDRLLLDVRTPEEFAEGHLAGALNVPVGELDGRLGELGAKERPVVVYCRSGMRSARAAGKLREAGFVSVHDLGGIGNGADVHLETVR